MEQIQYVPIIIYVVIYAIVFLIQKSQIDKQKEIMGKYEKMFSIINIDEIQKYVDLKEQSLKLDFENREKEIKKVETSIGTNLSKAQNIITRLNNLEEERNDLESVKTSIKAMIPILNKDLKNTKTKYEKLSILYELEFKEIYEFIIKEIKPIDESKVLNFEMNVYAIRNEYLLKKEEILSDSNS